MTGMSDQLAAIWHARRKLLPTRVILVRHGESEGNVDHTMYRTKADNMIELTDKGSAQAEEVGKRIKQIIGDSKVDICVSPFQRTLQTARCARKSFDQQIRRTHIDSRIREQEFGNLQGEDFKSIREEQKRVGRFYYRFPTGESGGDVYDRTAAWWDSALCEVNDNPNYDPVDTVVVFTHGLTIRYILMQLYRWSPHTFETVWNAGNCDMYVLKKDLSMKARYPYKLDPNEGDMPKSTVQLLLKLTDGKVKEIDLNDYLSIPQPRTTQVEITKAMIHQQHGIDPSTIASIDFFGGTHHKFS